MQVAGEIDLVLITASLRARYRGKSRLDQMFMILKKNYHRFLYLSITVHLDIVLNNKYFMIYLIHTYNIYVPYILN